MARSHHGGKGPIEGMEEIYAFLRSIPKELEAGSVTVVNAMLGPIAAAMKKQLTAMKVKRTGLLRKSLTKKTRRYRSGLVWGAVGPNSTMADTIGVRKKRNIYPSAYAHLVNLGTLPHEIKFKKRKRVMMHPGTKARPFQRAAVAASKRDAVNKGLAELQKQIAKAVAKGKL